MGATSLDWRDVYDFSNAVLSLSHNDLILTPQYEKIQVLDHYMPLTLPLSNFAYQSDWVYIDQSAISRRVSGVHLRLPHVTFDDMNALFFFLFELYSHLRWLPSSSYSDKFENLSSALEIIQSFCFRRDVDDCCDLLSGVDMNT